MFPRVLVINHDILYSKVWEIIYLRRSIPAELATEAVLGYSHITERLPNPPERHGKWFGLKRLAGAPAWHSDMEVRQS